MKKILFISYVFPPTGGAGVQRTVKLVKYFSRLGWDVSVLTAKNPSVPVFDERMLNDVPETVKIYKSFSFELPYSVKRRLWNKTAGQAAQTDQTKQEVPTRQGLKAGLVKAIKFLVHAIFIPDPQNAWLPATSRAAQKIIKKEKIDYVFISAPPFSSLLLIPKLRKTKARLVADFRDEWTEFYLKAYDFHQRDQITANRIIRMEQSVMEAADLITMATHSFVENYRKKYPQYNGKIKVLTNGYDPDDFAVDRLPEKDEHVFKITYTGTIFNVTTARYLLEAVTRLISAEPSLKEKIRENFVGRITDEEQLFFDQFKYPEILQLKGYVPHDQSVRELLSSDLLVVIIDELEGSERIIAAKVFEYIYTGKPVLALVPENGEVAKIVKETQTGVVISNRKIGQIEQALKTFVNGEYSFAPRTERIQTYSREEIAKQLMDYLSKIGRLK